MRRTARIGTRVVAGAAATTPTGNFVCGRDRGRAGVAGLGILGKHSPVPPGKISLDLNYDALAPIGDPEQVEVSRGRTTFYNCHRSAGENHGISDSGGY